ncbi:MULTISPECIES: HK97 gp10 family phage protein [Peribacillus]|uniref:HK97 gp10 family phage protein n=1 Tax=Peribacillus TaxID=2675229 RepID=UPI001F4EAD43|nr:MULTISPECIES: HK97 gp10 family phage protein [unclassified Peribacillus]MCK1982229.1 HK97 gp10 family phage protein [Peribacillus sp. Aquil_B1]MCK2007419.1 HK97 gp10 family phage protein [Peribacillus sp. Aquil_B8]
MSEKDDVIRLEWDGLEEFEDLLFGMEDEVERIAKVEMTKYGLLVEEGTKALAPKDTGDLEQSINFGPATREGGLIVVEGGSNLEYALRRHEEPSKMGIRDKFDNGAKFDNYYIAGKGRKTLRKPTWRGYKAGRKFLQNAINATEEDYNKMNERILERLLGGDKE